MGTRLPVGVGADVGEHPPELALRGAIAAALVLADQQQNTLIAAMLDGGLAAAGGHR